MWPFLLMKYLLIILLSYQPVMQSQDPSTTPLSEEGLKAYETLLKTPIFSLVPVGFAAVTSEGELALSVLLDEKEAVNTLKQLCARANNEGKMYALYGLYVKDREAYRQEAERYRSEQQDQMINTQTGCLLFVEKAEAVINKIESGHYQVFFNKRAGRN